MKTKYQCRECGRENQSKELIMHEMDCVAGRQIAYYYRYSDRLTQQQKEHAEGLVKYTLAKL